MKQGTIILTPFPFTDLSASKRRPAIIISKNNNRKNDVIIAFISSKIPKTLSKFDYLLLKNHKDFNKTGLIKDSVFKMDKIVTIQKDIVVGELGFVSNDILNELLLRLKKIFNIQ